MKNELNNQIAMIDKAIFSYIDGMRCQNENKKVIEAMNYSIASGGKRLRPVILLSSCKACGGAMDLALPFAVALEMIHTYSLIHDDLPAMDDDDFRRSKPSNHKVFGEGIAILAGDGLLNLAYEIMFDSCFKSGGTSVLKAAYVISEAAGVNGMIGGQCADLVAQVKGGGESDLCYIHTHKTGALIAAAFEAGAYLAGMDAVICAQFREAGYLAGMAFQIQDDILDVCATQEVLGKPTHSDDKNQKLTAVGCYGLEGAKEQVLAYTKRANEQLASTQTEYHFLLWLINSLVDRAR